MLLSILQSEKDAEIKDILKNVKNILDNLEGYKPFKGRPLEGSTIKCYSPRLIVSQSGKNIYLHKLSPENWKSKDIILHDDCLRYDI